MGATQYSDEASAAMSKSSCKSLFDEDFPADDAVRGRRSCSRSYCSNRFSSYSTIAALVLAVYLFLPLGILATAAEQNPTTSILTEHHTEALIAPSRHDVDNEISITPNEIPIKEEKEEYIPPSLAENLEDTIRNSVKDEIEKEQIAVSPALLNAYKVLPESEKVLLVGYTGTVASDLKNELPLEANSEVVSSTKCDARSLICLRPNKEEMPSSTPVSISDGVASTTPAEEILTTTSVIPTSTVSETVLQETTTQIVEQDSNSEVEHDKKTISEKVPEILNSVIVPEESQSQNGPSERLLADNETKELVPIKTSVTIEQLLDTKENQADVAKAEDESSPPVEGEPTSVIQTEVVNSTDIANETIVHFREPQESETEVGTEDSLIEPVVEPRNLDLLSSEKTKVTLSETQHAGDLVDETAIPSIAENGINKPEEETSTALTESTTRTVDVEENKVESVDSSSDVHAITNETTLPEILEIDLNAIPEESIGVTPPSELPLAALENETLSITFEEALTATEPSVERDDGFVKTVINMEDPVLEVVQPELTTVVPESVTHSVIKKQGVEPIVVELPAGSADPEVESATLLPRISIPIGSAISEEESVQRVKTENDNRSLPLSNESEAVVESKTVDPPVSDENQSTSSTIETVAQDITELSVVFPGKGDSDASLSSKGSRSINALHSPLAGQQKASINFDIYPAGQTFNENLAEELPNGIGKVLPTQGLTLQASNGSTILIAVCSCTAFLFIVVSVSLFMASFQRHHGTLDIEMQERRDNTHDHETETCLKLLDIELPTTSLSNQTDAEAEIEECL